MTPHHRCHKIGDDGRSDLVSTRRAQVPGPVRAMLVVMRGVLVQNRAKVPWPGDQQRSVTSARAVRTQRSAWALPHIVNYIRSA